MYKLRSKLTKRIMAAALSIAMILPNMTVYADELAIPEAAVEATAENAEVEDAGLSLTQEAPTEEKASVDEDASAEEKASVGEDASAEEKASVDEETPAEAEASVEEEAPAEVEASVDEEAVALSDGEEAGGGTTNDGSETTPTTTELPTSWNFRSSGTNSLLDSTNGATYEKETEIATVAGLRIDTTKGKFSLKRSDWAIITENTIIKVPVAGLSKVTVESYKGSSYTVDGKANTVDSEKSVSEPFICSGTKEEGYEGKWVTIVWGNGETYIGSIKVEAVPELTPTANTPDTGLDTNFKTLAASMTDNGEIDTSASSTINDLKGIAVKNIVWHNPTNGSHGIVTQDKNAMALQIPKKANITILGCQFGNKALPLAIDASGKSLEVVEKAATEDYADGAAEAAEYTISGAEGIVTLCFTSGMYIHRLKVEYVTGQYAIKVTTDGNGTASADVPYADKDVTVTLTATPNKYYEFDKWDVTPENVTVGEDNTFEMPAGDVEIKACFKSTGPRTEWDFRDTSDTTLYLNQNFEGASAGTGGIVDIAGLKIDVTNGKFAPLTVYNNQPVNNTQVKAGTKINIPVTGVETNDGVKVTMKWWMAGSKYTVAGGNELTSLAGHNNNVVQTVECRGTNGYVEVELTETNNYLELIKIEPLYYVADGLIDFKDHSTELDGKPVDNINGIEFNNIKYHGTAHGLNTSGSNPSMTLNLAKDETADLELTTCGEGAGENATISVVNAEGTEYTPENINNIPEGDSKTGRVFTIPGESGKVTIKFTYASKTTYIHSLKVTYKTTSSVETKPVTVNPKLNGETLAATELEGAIITFTDKYVAEGGETKKYSFTIGTGEDKVSLNEIKLPVGYYDNISVYNNKYKLTEAGGLTVSGDGGTCELQFEEYTTSWDFSDSIFQTNYTQDANLTWYNGLGLKNTYANNDYANLGTGGEVTIPVKGECDITVNYYAPNWEFATIGGENFVENEASKVYKHRGEAGSVTIALKNGASKAFSLSSITITYILKPAKDAANGTDINFIDKFTSGNHNGGDAVTDIDEIAVKNITYHKDDESHGLVTADNNAMVLTIPEGKRADITILGCKAGSNDIISAIGSVETEGSDETEASFRIVKTTAKENYTGTAVAPEYTVLGAEGTVTLSFESGMRIHNLKVNYWAEEVTNKYVITVTSGGNGTASADVAYAAEGDTITLTATPYTDYIFKEWKVPEGVTVTKDNTFTMPAANVEIQALFETTGPRKEWDFRDLEDTTLYGDGQTTYEGSTAGTNGIVDIAGLKIDVNDGKFAPLTGDKSTLVEATTKIKVPVTDVETTAGVKVTVKWKDDGTKYTVAGKELTSADQAAQTVRCKGTDGYVEVVLTEGNNSLELIKVEPLNYVGADPVSFRSLELNADLTAYKNQGIAISNLRADGQGQGIIANDNATMVLSLEDGKKADITVESCRLGAGENSSVTASAAGESLKVVKEKVEEGDGTALKFTVLGAEGEVTLSIGNNTYVHQIAVEYSDADAYKDKYIIKVTGDGNGTASADLAYAEAGTEIILTATPNEAHKFKEWNVISGGVTVDENDKFEMPASDVEVQAIFEKEAVETITSKTWYLNKDTLTDAVLTSGNLDGLSLSGPIAHENKAHAQLGAGAKIEVPVEGDCTITVTYYYAAAATIGGESFTTINSTNSTSKIDKYPYSYYGGAGTVEIVATGTTYITEIEISDPMYPVAINVANTDTSADAAAFTLHDLAGVEIKCTPAGGTASTYVIGEVEKLKLAKGTYTIALGNNNSYLQGVTLACDKTSLTLKDATASLTINVSGYTANKEVKVWAWGNDGADKTAFNTAFPSDKGLQNGWYKGLKLTQVRSHNSGQYAYMSNGSKISVPVKGKCKVSVTTYPSPAGTVGGLPFGDKSYYYTQDKAGYMDIATTGTTYIENIKIEELSNETYTVTLNPTSDITVDDLKGAEIVFTDAISGEVKKTINVADNATVITADEIGEGTYKVAVYKSGVFVQQNTDATLTVTENCEHEITFKSYITKWDFSDTKFQSDRYANGTYTWYNGLGLTKVKKNGTKYAYLNTANESVIKIPVKQDCKITLGYYENKAEGTEIATLGVAGEENPYKIVAKATNGDFTDNAYEYSGEAGEVLLSAKTDFYVSSITIKYQEETPTQTVTVLPKQGNTVLTETDLAGTEITFTDIDDPDGKEDFIIGSGEGKVLLDGIKLKKGTYSVSVYNSNVYVPKTIENLTVGDTAVTCEIPFDAYIEAWDFSDSTFQTDYTQTAALTWYNGLEITGAFAHNGQYAYMGSGHKIKIPVKADCDIKVSFYPNPSATIGGVALKSGGTEPVSQTYEYKGGKDYVEIAATATTYLIGISITYKTTPGGIDEGGFLTYTFDPKAEGIANDGTATPAGTKLAGGRFEVVDGAINGKNGTTVELANKATSSIQFVARGESDVVITANSTGGSNNSNLVLYQLGSDGKWSIVGGNDGIKLIEGSKNTEISYENLPIGTYKVSVPSEDHEYGRGVRIAKIVVTEKLTAETVTVDVTAPSDADINNILFTCRETGAVVKGTLEDGKCIVELYAMYSYDISVDPDRYVVKTGAYLDMGAASEDLTKTHDITIEAVTLKAISGKVLGLDADALKAVEIILEEPEGAIYKPEVKIDAEGNYTAELEDDVEYTIVTKNINDYQLDADVAGNSATVKISEATKRDITYKKKPVQTVTIIAKDGDTDITDTLKTAGATVKFTNLGLREGCEDDEGYNYTFNLSENISLRAGVYSVEVDNSGKYVQQLTSNLEVNDAPVSKTLMFRSDIRKWVFTDASFASGKYTNAGAYNYNGLEFTNGQNNKNTYLLHGKGTISVPVKAPCTVIVKTCYQYSFYFVDENEDSVDVTGGSTSDIRTYTYNYTGTEEHVNITVKSQSYINSIEVVDNPEYKPEITVGKGTAYDYETINDALDAVRQMDRKDGNTVKPVTIKIQPGDYEEMLVIDVANVKLVNASLAPSTKLRNNGVDIDPNAVRITSYYGHGFAYYSMGSDYKWHEDVLAVNQANGYQSVQNPGSGDSTMWNATVAISASGVSAEGIIFENSFNQYVSRKASEDTIVAIAGAKEGAVHRADMGYGDTTVQEKAYVERAAALGLTAGAKMTSFDNCKFIGHQDTIVGKEGSTVAFYNCGIYGGTDYICGGMTAVFAKCDLLFLTSDDNNDVGYITAAQNSDKSRGYLMYNCHVTSAVPGVDISSKYHTSKPGYFGRPWAKDTGEALFYYTVIDEADAHWRNSNASDQPVSLILPAGWSNSLNGVTESALSQEYGTYEKSGVNNQSTRAAWATKLTEEEANEKATVGAFLGSWNPFDGKDMVINTEGSTSGHDKVATPGAEPTTGSTLETAEKVDVNQKVTLKPVTPDSTIYYTISKDGSEPAAPAAIAANEYKGEDIILDTKGTTIIKALAIKAGMETSDVATFVYKVRATDQVDEPNAEPATGSTVETAVDVEVGQKVTLTPVTPDSTIYYTISKDGNESADPTAVEANEYKGEITLDTAGTTIIKAMATKAEMTDSDVITFVYNVKPASGPVEGDKVDSPSAVPATGSTTETAAEVEVGQKVTLTPVTPDSTIYYTISKNGTDPAEPTAENVYDGGEIALDTEGTTIIKAKATKADMTDSDVVKFVYIVKAAPKVRKPESETPDKTTVKAADKVKLKLAADAVTDTKIYYTAGKTAAETADPAVGADGTPVEGTTPYDLNGDGIEIGENPVIKAIAVATVEGKIETSEVATFEYILVSDDAGQVATPTATVNGDAVNNNASITVNENTDVVVTLTSETDAVIYYTLDGTTPTRDSQTYPAAGITISAIKDTTIVKAIATKTAMLDSDVLTITINVKKSPVVTGEKGLVVEILEKDITYTGKAITPAIAVRNNGIPLTEGIDYTVKYSNNVKATNEGETNNNKLAKITVTGKGNLSANNTYYFAIKKRSIADASVYKPTSLAVVKNKKVTPILLYNGDKLSAKDYTIDPSTLKFADPTPAGTAIENYTTKVKIDGNGNFTGHVEIPVKVVDKASDLPKFTVTIQPGQTFTYDGTTEHKPVIDVKDAKTKESIIPANGNPAEYYYVSYSNNVDAGTAKFTVVGLGEYAGCSVTKSFKIKPMVAEADKINVTLTKTDKKYPFVSTGVIFTKDDLTVTYKPDAATSKTLTYGKDYKVTCSGNKKVTPTAKYKVTFLGNYKGTKPVSGDFEITAAPIDSTATVVVADKVYTGKKLYKSAPFVMVGDSLLKASNYTVEYYMDADFKTTMDKIELAESQASATVYVKIIGKGNYAASADTVYATGQYKVWQKTEKIDLSKAKVTLYKPDEKDPTKRTDELAKKMEYTGEELKPIAVVEYKDGGAWKEVPTSEYTVSYVNNVNKGKATVVVNPATSADGKNTCAGSKNATFSIVARNLKNLTNLFK